MAEVYPIYWIQLIKSIREVFNRRLFIAMNQSVEEMFSHSTIQSDGEVPVMLELWGMRSIPSLPSLPAPLWPCVVAPDRVLSMGQIEINCVFIVNWITWNRTVLTFKLHTYAKLNCLKWNFFSMLNWIVWNCFWHWNCTYAKLNCLK